MLPRFKDAGALRQVVTQIWNQELHPRQSLEYADEKAFIACQELFREAEATHSDPQGYLASSYRHAG